MLHRQQWGIAVTFGPECIAVSEDIMPRLTRQELYDLIWSTPMTKLAESFGVSDVGLAKICDRHRVPKPPRGYWAKKEAGKPVKQTIFVQVDDPLLDHIIIEAHDRIPEPVREIIAHRRVERKAARSARPRGAATPAETESIADPHPAIQATAMALRKAKPSERGVVEAIGPGLCGISIGVKSVERIISLLDRLARVCDARGMCLVPRERQLAAAIGPDEATFEITEKTRQVPHVMTSAEVAAERRRHKRNERIARGIYWNDDYILEPPPPKFDTVRTGQLGVRVFGWGDRIRRSWNDGKTQTLETLFDEFVDGLEAHIVAKRLRREERERAEAEYRELERRRSLAKERRDRENERNRLLNRLMRAKRQVTQLKEWLATYEHVGTLSGDAALNRMFEWARARLAALEASLEPTKLVEELAAMNLFPEIDELHDPLGDPPAERDDWL